MPTRYRLSSQIKFNVKSYLEREFVNNGLYFNVSSGTIDINDNNIGFLTRVDGYTYESFFDRWVYESDASGVAPYNTTIASGVYVNGTFYAKGAAPYYPAIDYDQGRVVFSSPVPANTTISANFSYKHIAIDFPKSNIINLLSSESKDNVDVALSAFPSGNQRQLPRIVIDLQRRYDEPFAIGGPKLYNQHIIFHIITNTEHEMDQIVDILTDDQMNKQAFVGVNFNKIPQILTYQGDKAPTYIDYTSLQQNSSYNWVKLYIEEPRVMEKMVWFDYYRARVDWNVTLIT